jgi:catechol 2,3-dioxygenase-like lactoylglutathione lyase family enzyme
MSVTKVHSVTSETSVRRINMNLEIQVIPVSDVDRSKDFYERLGWRLDDDAAPLDGLRIVQFTPPRLGDLGHVRQGTHNGRARIGRGWARRLRYRGGP